MPENISEVFLMNQIMISIVIPVYNVEKYIEQCIDSILNQTYPYFELICVDDGSTDSSYEILKKYEKQDSRVIVIQQKNQYAGVARNRGMEIAKGKYILFLDADDFIEENTLELLVDYAEKQKTEVLVFDAFQYDNVTEKVINTLWVALKPALFGKGIKAADEMRDVVFDFTTPVPWNKFYLREFVECNQLQFQNLKRTNDLFFVYASLACANRIGMLEEKLYYYRDNNKSSLQGSGDETPEIYAQALFELKDWLEKRDYWNKFKKSFSMMAISLSLYNWNNMVSEKAYHVLADKLQSVIFPKLCLGENKIKSVLYENLLEKRNITVYGAGNIASALVKYLLYKYGYKKNQITIVVSDKGNNEETICNIRVQSFKELEEDKKEQLVIIAVADKKAQDAIINNLLESRYMQYVTVGFDEIASLVRNSNF